MVNSIAEPLTTIIGGPEVFINTGSTINLTCIVKNSPESPFAMYWTHNNEVSLFKRARPSISVPLAESIFHRNAFENHSGPSRTE